MKYVYVEDGIVREIIPEFNPVFPGIPITERYYAEFVNDLIPVSDDTHVEQNWMYDSDTGAFNPTENAVWNGESPEPEKETTYAERLSAVESAVLAMMQEG